MCMRCYSRKRKPKHMTKLKIIRKHIKCIDVSFIQKSMYYTKRYSYTINYGSCVEHFTAKFDCAMPVDGYEYK